MQAHIDGIYWNAVPAKVKGHGYEVGIDASWHRQEVGNDDFFVDTATSTVVCRTAGLPLHGVCTITIIAAEFDDGDQIAAGHILIDCHGAAGRSDRIGDVLDLHFDLGETAGHFVVDQDITVIGNGVHVFIGHLEVYFAAEEVVDEAGGVGDCAGDEELGLVVVVVVVELVEREIALLL